MEKYFVVFCSPGTFVDETTEKPIESWDIEKAKVMATDVHERYGARPFGFYFTTRSRGEEDLDSKEIASSGVYYLGGVVETREQVEARNDPSEDILRTNMRCNEIERVITNKNSFKTTRQFRDKDTLLEFSFPVGAVAK